MLQGTSIVTLLYLKTWTTAKVAARRLRHPIVTSEHLLYACLRLHDQRHWELCRGLPVTAEVVWSHLRQNPPSEASEDFAGVLLGQSAKAAFERAEAEVATYHNRTIGTESLMRALLAEPEGPVRSLLDSRGASDETPLT
jgi:ATP-dependent Clp protease ATP-binding subunit ClpA